jgi:hypothetical protein
VRDGDLAVTVIERGTEPGPDLEPHVRTRPEQRKEPEKPPTAPGHYL